MPASGPLLALARHETRRLGRAFQGRSTKAALAAVVLLLVVAWPAVRDRGIHPDLGLYPVSLSPDAALGPAARFDPRFRVVPPGTPALLLLAGPEVRYDPSSQAAIAALAELREGLRSWQEAELGKEADQAAAFPLQVSLAFQPRDLTAPSAPSFPAGPPPSSATSTATQASTPRPTASPTLPAASLLNETSVTAHTQTGLHPSQVQPPFPVRSLLLTFAYLIPLNFIAQLYAGSFLGDRIRHRGLLALTTPHAPATVLLGRSLPYLAAGGAVFVAASLLVRAGALGWLAALPIVLFVLASAVVLGLLARSERELTFLLTGTTTLFSTFLFLPAVFAALPPVAFLSPVSVLSASIEGHPVAWGPLLYATVPLLLAALALALIAVGLHREEALFSQQGLGAKLRFAMARWTASRRGLLVAGILAVPFTLALELFTLALVIPLGLVAAFPLFVVGAALLEESLKLAVTAAGRRKGRSGWRAGAWVGAGFFAGEKLALLVALAGFGSLELGIPTLRLLGVQGGLLLLLAPLALHAAAAAIAGAGVGKGRLWGRLAWLGAVSLHTLYNTAVVLRGAG